MKKSLTATLLGVSAGVLMAALPLTASAGTVVRQLDAETLMVIDYSGKPPFKRTLVRAEDATEFARFEEAMNASASTSTFSVFRRGAPGKLLPAHSRAPASEEVVEFARFEARDDAKSDSPRRWRGAPGKR